jgi:hypothetical protein
MIPKFLFVINLMFANLHIFSFTKKFIFYFSSIEPNSDFMSETGVKPTDIIISSRLNQNKDDNSDISRNEIEEDF